MKNTGYQTPWGTAQEKNVIFEGVTFYSTAGHGGIKVLKELNKKIPAEFRNKSGWYEEDCEALIPAYFIIGDDRELIKEGLKRWFPDAYEYHFIGEKAPTKEVLETIKDNDIFSRMKKGSVIEFKEPVLFQDGSSFKELKWLGGSKFTHEGYIFPLFSISNWKREKTLVDYKY